MNGSKPVNVLAFNFIDRVIQLFQRRRAHEDTALYFQIGGAVLQFRGNHLDIIRTLRRLTLRRLRTGTGLLVGVHLRDAFRIVLMRTQPVLRHLPVLLQQDDFYVRIQARRNFIDTPKGAEIVCRTLRMKERHNRAISLIHKKVIRMENYLFLRLHVHQMRIVRKLQGPALRLFLGFLSCFFLGTCFLIRHILSPSLPFVNSG